MEEIIKPNDYVRTHNGRIYKVTNVYVLKVTCGHTSLRYSEITKHSPNIIDLIEVGDYVNGNKVVETYRDSKKKDELFLEVVVSSKMIKQALKDYIDEEHIKSIVTHESFNSIKYEVI